MERTPIEGRTELHDIVVGLYNIVFADELEPEDIDLYYIESEYVEAEIQLPYIGVNRKQWEEEWSAERKLEVLLHEFAHIEEAEDELDHEPTFYDRLVELSQIAESHRSAVEDLFGTSIDFESVHRHIIDSVNEYTVESDLDDVETRQEVLREEFGLPAEATED
ncbi:MAG: hypothetical protein ABEH65_10975 [Halobacteriales archaeon]